MENKVLTPEELQKLKNTQTNRNALMRDFGYIEYQIQELELQKEGLIEALAKIKSDEIQIAKELQEKYGEGAVDIDKGEFIKSN
jgi:stress response protein YsnF